MGCVDADQVRTVREAVDNIRWILAVERGDIPADLRCALDTEAASVPESESEQRDALCRP